MGRTRILILAVAAVAAIGLALIIRGVAAGGDRPQTVTVTAAQAPRPMAKVLVARRDLARGARLTAEDMTWQEWPVEAVNTTSFITDGSVTLPRPPAPQPVAAEERQGAAREGAAARDASGRTPAQRAAATDAQQGRLQRATNSLLGHPNGPIAALEGAIVREPILQGEPIVERKLVRGGDSGLMAIVLQPGMRAMAIAVSVETAAGGFILPGDHVDVLLSRSVPGGAQNEFVTSTLLRNIRVLAIDQTVAPEADAATVVGATATLEVGAREAELLALGDAQGELAMVLRSYADLDEPSGPGGSTLAGLSGAVGSSPRPVRVWRNGQPTSVAQP